MVANEEELREEVEHLLKALEYYRIKDQGAVYLAKGVLGLLDYIEENIDVTTISPTFADLMTLTRRAAGSQLHGDFIISKTH
ncbi:hypothetical protein SP695_004643 [Salmonella enterica]|nr:hypothetical protein [Salmonella enterica]